MSNGAMMITDLFFKFYTNGRKQFGLHQMILRYKGNAWTVLLRRQQGLVFKKQFVNYLRQAQCNKILWITFPTPENISQNQNLWASMTDSPLLA